jgi:hypothetical protein
MRHRRAATEPMPQRAVAVLIATKLIEDADLTIADGNHA